MIFSELPQQDKIKYFNFLLENDINFSRDESGNYVALVKVLNPAFYGGAQNNNIKAGIINKEKVNKNSKQILNDKKGDKVQVKNIGDKNKISENEGDNNNLKNKKGKMNKECFEKEKKYG